MRNAAGHYRLARGWIDNPLWGNDPYCKRAAWVWLIDNAAFARRRFNIEGKEILLERGQLCASIRFLANAWGWKNAKAQRFLDKLKKWNAIDTHSNPFGDTLPSIITICNYERYQATARPTDTSSDTPPEREPIQNRKNDNSLSKDKGGNPPPNDLDKLLYQRGKELLGKSAGGQITKLKMAQGVGKALETIDLASRKENPGEYIAGVLRNGMKSSDATPQAPIVGSREAADDDRKWGIT